MAKEFVERLQGLLAKMDAAIPENVTVESKRFFSGGAAYAEGRIFISLTPVGLAIKLPEPEFSRLKEKGGTPLRYFPKAPIKKSYLIVPDGLAKNTRTLRRLVKISIAYVLTLPKPQPKPKPGRGKG